MVRRGGGMRGSDADESPKREEKREEGCHGALLSRATIVKNHYKLTILPGRDGAKGARKRPHEENAEKARKDSEKTAA